MIVITGAYGFIGSCLLSKLNKEGKEDIVIVDDFSKDYKIKNLDSKKYSFKIDRIHFIEWFKTNNHLVSGVYHLGARTDTTEQNNELFEILNLNYSKEIWKICTKANIPLIYASSAATYGNGEKGFDDDHEKIVSLKPLNPYGWSKQNFDLWALEQKSSPPKWVGLKFFNVYGPNESHKGRMASVIFHSFNKIIETKKMELFMSHRKGIEDGHQSRDFIYVKDIIAICDFCMNKKIASGIYNAGTGKARTFLDLTVATFNAIGKEVNITFIETPKDIRDTYQYYTEANMSKLIGQGFDHEFITLETGVNEYVSKYLIDQSYF
jgi:ADP-L-glycero-D-manno-heptose 6-epimerase